MSSHLHNNSKGKIDLGKFTLSICFAQIYLGHLHPCPSLFHCISLSGLIHIFLASSPSERSSGKHFPRDGRKMQRKFGETFCRFSSFNFQENGRKKFHKKSSTFSTVHFRCCNSGRWRAQCFLGSHHADLIQHWLNHAFGISVIACDFATKWAPKPTWPLPRQSLALHSCLRGSQTGTLPTGTLRLCENQESSLQTKPKKGQFMNFPGGIPEQKFNVNRACFPKENTPGFIKMGEIHELFVLALSLVWFAGATPEKSP